MLVSVPTKLAVAVPTLTWKVPFIGAMPSVTEACTVNVPSYPAVGVMVSWLSVMPSVTGGEEPTTAAE